MASTTDGCCLNDPNFAVICSFINNFGDKLLLPDISFEDLQESLEDTKATSDLLVDLHVHLLRRIGKKVTTEKWQRSVIKFCHYFDNADAWEIEQNGYEKTKVSTKLKVLKNLLETQFDLNLKFKDKIGEIDPTVLRCQPLGRDINGGAYWYIIDKELNLRIYREEHPTLKEDEVWKVICRDRDDLASLVATLDAEINPNGGETVQDAKIEEECKEEEGIAKEEGIIKEEEKTDSSTISQQNDIGHQPDKKSTETDKVADVESNSVADGEIKNKSAKSTVTINSTEEEPESKSILKDGCVKVEPEESILKAPLKQAENAEGTAASDGTPKSMLEDEKNNELKKDKTNTDSVSESKAEKRKLAFSEPTEIGSKSRKECSDHVLSSSQKSTDNNDNSEKIPEIVSKETAAANLRRESVIKIGKRVDKVIPVEESAKQNPSENKEELAPNKSIEKETCKTDDIVVISDTDKDIEAIVKNEEVKKRMNELNKSPNCYKLNERLNEEMNRNIQFTDDENFDDKIVLMKEYTKDYEQLNMCKEKVSSAFRSKPVAVGSEEKVQTLCEEKVVSVAETSDSDKTCIESESKSVRREEMMNKLQSFSDSTENILSKKCIEKPEKGSDLVHSENKDSEEKLKGLGAYKKENQLQNKEDILQKSSKDATKEVNIEKKADHKIYNCEKESSNDEKQMKLVQKSASCKQDSTVDEKSLSSDKGLDSQKKPGEKESDTQNKEKHSSGKISHDPKEELISSSKPQATEKESITGNISGSDKKQSDAADMSGDKKGEVVVKSLSQNSKSGHASERKNVDTSSEGKLQIEIKSSDTKETKSKPSDSEEKFDTGDKKGMIASGKPDNTVEKTNSGSKPGSEKEAVGKEKLANQEKKEEAAAIEPCSQEKKLDAKFGDNKREAITKISSSDNEKKSDDTKCSDKKDIVTAKCDSKEKTKDDKEKTAKSSSGSEEKSGGDTKSSDNKEKTTVKSSPETKDKSSDSKEKLTAKSSPESEDKSSDIKEKATDKSKPSESENKSSDNKEKATAKTSSENENKSSDSKKATAKSKPSESEDKCSDIKEKATDKSKPSENENKSSDNKEKATAKTSSESENKSSESKVTAKSKPSGSEDKSSDIKEKLTAKSSPESKEKFSDIKEKATAKSKPSENENKSSENKKATAKTSSENENKLSDSKKVTAKSKPSESEDKSSDSKEKLTAKSSPESEDKSSDIKEKATDKSKPSESENKSSDNKEKATAKTSSENENKSSDSKKAIAKSKLSESEDKSSDSKEKAAAKSRIESEGKSKSDKDKPVATSSSSSEEKSEDKSKSCNNEELVSKNRPHDIEDLSSKQSLNSEKEPGGKSRPLGSEVEPGGKSCSIGNNVKAGNKNELLGPEIEQSAENKLHKKEEEEEASNRDKPLKKDDEAKPGGSSNKESSKSAIAPDENSENIDDGHHSEDLPKLKISLNKINDEMSAGNEEKKLTCKIVIKRKSRRKDCAGGGNADGTDEVDDHEDDEEDSNDNSEKMTKNREDNIEYKCELSSVSADTTEESGKTDCVQRLRKRKACDRMPITPSKNDRKTEDLGNEECAEQIQNDDKVTNQNLKPEGESDIEESNVRTSRRLRSRRTNKPLGSETEQTKTESSKEEKPTVPVNTENETQPIKKTRSKRRTQDELLCMDFIIPDEEKRTRGRKRQNTSVETLIVEEVEPKKAKGSKNIRKTKVSRLKDAEEQCSSPSDSDDMPLSKMTRTTSRGRARGRGPRKGQRQPLTEIEESVPAPPKRKSLRTATKKKEEINDAEVKIPPATGKSVRGGSSAAGKGSRSRQRKKRGSSVESDKWVSDKTEGEEEEEDDEEEEDLFVGELLRRSSRVRSLGTKNKLLCVSASSDEEKSETNEDTSDEEFQLPKGRNARRAAARSAATEEAEIIDENDNEPCRNCQKFDRPETILLCDKCDAGYHTLCLTPPLHIIPEGDWFCPPCEHRMLLEKLTTNLHELDIQLKKRERLMKRKERLAFVGISLDNILSEKKENMEPNVDCPVQVLSTTRTCRARRSINYKFTEFDELIDSAIQDDLSAVHHYPEGTTEDSSQNGKDINNSGEEPVSLGKNMDTIMTAYSDDLRPQGIQAKKEAGRRRGKDISNLVGRGSDSDEQYPAPRKRRPKRKLTTLDSDSYASDSDEYKASEDSDASADMDASEYSEEEEDDDDDEDYGIRRRSTRTSTYRASRKSGRAATRRSRRQRFDDFVVDDDYDSEESANYRRSTRASVKRKVNYREKGSDEDEEEEAEMTPSEEEESSTELSDLGSDESIKPNKKLKLKLTTKKTKRVIRESPSEDDDDDKSSKSSGSVSDDKNKKKLTRKRRLASDSGSSLSSESESTVRRSCRASTQKMNFKNLLDSDTEEEIIKIERPYTVTRPKLKVIMSDSDSIASDDKSSIKSFTLDKNDNDSKFSHSSTTTTTTAVVVGADNDDADPIPTITLPPPPLPTITIDTTPATITPSTTTTTTTTTMAPTPVSINNNNSHEAHLKADQQQNEGKTVDSSFSQMNGHDNETADTKDTHLEKTENRTISTELHREDNCNNDKDDTSNLGTSTSRSGPQVHP